MTIGASELSSEDSLRLNVLMMANPVQAVRIDEGAMTLYALTENGEAKVQLHPNCRADQYIGRVKQFLGGHALGSPGGYPVYLQRWTRMGQTSDKNLEALLLLGEPEAVVAVAHALSGQWMRVVGWLAAAGAASVLVYGAVAIVEVLLRPLPPEALTIPTALGFSFLRLLAAYAISLAWTVPLAAWVSRSARRVELVMPPVQVLASIPATAFFPLLVAGVLRFGLDLNVSAILLVLTGMQWYLLFNLVAAAQGLPEDLRELARMTEARGLVYLRRFFLPAALPSLITGSITAWGGGWNALVLAESVTADGRTWSVDGIGALLEEATYVRGGLQMIVLVIVAMVGAVLLLNRAVWRPLYGRASVRYRLDG